MTVSDAVFPTAPPFEPGEPGIVPVPPTPPGGFFAPTVTTQAAFGYAPFQSSPVWTDISRWAQNFTVRRGRQHELQRFEAGTWECPLWNQDGRFSPWNSSSPYAGHLVPGTPIRVQATWNGMTYPVYYGYVDSWIPQYGQTRAEQVVKATDGMGLLALAQLDQPTYQNQVIADGALALYMLSDQVGAYIAVDSTGNGHTGTVFPPFVTFGVAGPWFTNLATAATFATSASPVAPGVLDGGQIQAPWLLTGASAGSLEVWVKTSAVPAGPMTIWGGVPIGGPAALQIGSSGQVLFGVSVGTGALATGTTNVCDGNWHHVVGTWTSGGSISVYVDGVLQATSSSPPGTIGSSAFASIGNQTDEPPFAGDLAGAAVYTSALTSAQVLLHYQIGSAGFASPQYSGQRIAAILAAVGWPTFLENLATGISQVQAATGTLTQTQALSYIQTIEATEQGLFFVDESGRGTFRDRHYVVSAPAALVSNATLSNNPALAGAYRYLIGSMVPGEDALDLWTDVQGSRQNGNPQQAFNQANATKYGWRSLTGFTGMLQESDTEVLALCQWLLAHYDAPLTRVRSIAMDNTYGQGANLPAMLGRTFLDRVTVDWLPMDGTATHFTQDSLIESIQHEVTQGYWRTTWGLSPAETQQYLLLDDPVRGVLDGPNRWGY